MAWMDGWESDAADPADGLPPGRATAANAVRIGSVCHWSFSGNSGCGSACWGGLGLSAAVLLRLDMLWSQR